MAQRHRRDDDEATRDTGRLGYRREWEPMDSRPLLIEHACQCNGCREWEGPWRDQSERLEYENAVEEHPRQEGEGPMAYAARLSAVVVGRYKRVGQVPRVRQSRVERDRALAKLRGQMPRGTEVL